MAVNRKRGGESQRSSPAGNGQGIDAWINLLLRFRRFALDVIGVVFLAFAMMTALALVSLTQGILLTPWSDLLRIMLGWGSWVVVLAFGLVGLLMLNRQRIGLLSIQWGRILALEVAAFALLALLAVIGGVSISRAEMGLDGGRIGWGLANLLGTLLGSLWRDLLLGLAFIWGIITGFGQGNRVLGIIRRTLEGPTRSKVEPKGSKPVISVAPVVDQPEHVIKVEQPKPPKKQKLPPEFQKQFKIKEEKRAAVSVPPRDERLPPLDLLVDERVARPDERNINQSAGMIEKTLAEFGLPAKVVGFQVGPTVTQFAVEPGFIEKEGAEGEVSRQKVRVSQISALARDLALTLSAERLRIQAPVPGRPYVGIEVPNLRSSIVRLRPLLESEEFYRLDSQLAIALGRNVSGHPVVADLVVMPHLLIAGTTGSGKSVCIASLTTLLAMNNTPADLRIVMIDPKMVELVRFNGLPHLYGKVETDMKRILGVLQWTVMEMDRRYKLLEKLRARDIEAFNRKARRRKDEEQLPRIIVMIDELADLMMSAADQTEHALVRLAQMARATGIHLVVATQRPSTDVVTGLIKANFPARLSFAVASSVDSRVILDTQGAESLLGKGDMLFLPPEAGTPLRAQGVLVTDFEVEQIINYWRHNWADTEADEPPWEGVLAEETTLTGRDQLIEQAIELVRRTQRASASLLQRRLRIGYPRAARLIDQLEELGIVGPSLGSGRERIVLVGSEDDEPYD